MAKRDEVDQDTPRQRRKPDPDPEKVSEEALGQAALGYLDRYDATVEQLRRVLRRRRDKYAVRETWSVVDERIEQLLARLAESKVLDDARFAEGFARAARGRGGSSLRIRSKLVARGVDPELIGTALERLTEGEALDDAAAARAYVRKRRLTKRYDLREPAQRNRALAALARQGFAFSVAQEALRAESDAEDF